MHKFTTSLLILSILFPLAAHAYGPRSYGASIVRPVNSSTTGTFIDQQVWLPGSWQVNAGKEQLVFVQPSTNKNRESFVRITRIPREECAYGYARIRALKAWGGGTLQQTQGRIEPITFGTSKFRGYTWVEPSKWAGDRHYCLAQDLTGAVEVVAPEGDKKLAAFVKNDVMMQLAVRRGRSVSK